MGIVVLTNESLKTELLAQVTDDIKGVEWVEEPEELLKYPTADCIIDLLFQNNPERTALLNRLKPGTVMVSSLTTTLKSLPAGFVRINGWNTFLKRTIVEAACADEQQKLKTASIFTNFNKKIDWTPDVPGFISARVIATIINEAYFALQDEVSSKEEIDTAMKLGTNYPFGPFEWSRLIGLKNVHSLLVNLSDGPEGNKRYEPAALLTTEAFL